jgi:arylsulfatase A-like enzyme
MAVAPAENTQTSGTADDLLSARAALLTAAWIGLVGGYADLLLMFLRRKAQGIFYLQGREFPWTVPLAGLAFVMAPALLTVLANRIRPGLVTRPAAAWLFTTVALWGALLRLPLHAVASLVLAAGLGRLASRMALAAAARRPIVARLSLVGLFAAVAATAVATTGRHAWIDYRAGAGLPNPPAGAPNVLLIVMDTVRAESLSLYGHGRKTSPNLERWARKGVRFDWAVSPASWSFPSHASFFTGQWPYKLGAHEHTILNAPDPTLAEVLTSRGYLTAGFVANTTYCSHETRLDRGFSHYEDYVTSPRSLIASSSPGQWIARTFLDPRDAYGLKWTRFQSRDAEGINSAFLDWLTRKEGVDRPFFAFLNYFDAHEPFVLPDDDRGDRFGLRPESPRDIRFLEDYWQLDKTALPERDVTLVRDAYDDCIARLDREVGRLLDELDRRGTLENTLVIITSDHGEQFGERGLFDHGTSLYLREVRVPLLVIGPKAPAGLAVSEAVSLRELPATVVDQLGLSAGSPFPGRSLAERWSSPSGTASDGASPALSEGSFPIELDPRRGPGPTQRGYTLSLVAKGRHFIRDGGGNEELYELADDPTESTNLKGVGDAIAAARSWLLKALPTGPAPDYLGFYRRLLEAQVAGRSAPGGGLLRLPPSLGAPGTL